MDNNGSFQCDRMSLEGGSAEALVSISESKIVVQLENAKLWLAAGEH